MALKLFVHKRKSPFRNLTFQSRTTKHCIELVVQKNTVQAQLSASIDFQEQASFQGLLNPIKEKIRSYRRREKHCKKGWLHCKKQWLYKLSHKLFHKNPYKAEKINFNQRSISPNLLSFSLATTYNVLLSPSNLLWLHLSEKFSCFLCKKEHSTLAHILRACKMSL